MKQKRYKVLFGIIVVLIVGLVGFNLFWNGNIHSDKYTREATRKTIDLANTEFIKNLKHGNSYIDKYFQNSWSPMVIPISEKYQGLLKEKVVFMKNNEDFNNWTELVVFDTYSTEAFPSISSYLKKHAKELNEKHPEGKIKILHDGDKGIIYQWAIIKDGKTEYLEFGKVEMTNEGLLSAKYLNKGTEDLESQRQRAIKFFTKF